MDYKSSEITIKNILELRHDRAMQDVVEFLHMNFKHYAWVGIYIVKGDTLILGPWIGNEPTEHTYIPIGEGICGSAAQSGRTEIVDDVTKDDRYLSCFVSTKSEIVVPIKRWKKVIGEIDIDSDKMHAFSHEDKVFLEKIAEMLSHHIR